MAVNLGFILFLNIVTLGCVKYTIPLNLGNPVYHFRTVRVSGALRVVPVSFIPRANALAIFKERGMLAAG